MDVKPAKPEPRQFTVSRMVNERLVTTSKMKQYDINELNKVYKRAKQTMLKHQEQQKKNLDEFNREILAR